MPATAQQVRKRNRPFETRISGVDVVLKRPDIRFLIYTRTMPAPLLEKVGTLLAVWVGQDLTKLSEEAKKEGGDALEMLDFLTSVCLVAPKCVVGDSNDENILGTNDMDVDFKEAIVIRALTGAVPEKSAAAEVAAASRFSGGGLGEGTGPNVSGVRAEAVAGTKD